MWLLVILGIISIAIITICILAFAGDSPTVNNTKLKSIFGTCLNNFDCKLGFVCELRDHPSNGICVIPPGGACHPVEDSLKQAACYSGFFCDKQEGTCLKNK